MTLATARLVGAAQLSWTYLDEAIRGRSPITSADLIRLRDVILGPALADVWEAERRDQANQASADRVFLRSLRIRGD